MQEPSTPSGMLEAVPGAGASRERVALAAFVVTAVVATVSWLALLGWLVLVGLRAVGV